MKIGHILVTGSIVLFVLFHAGALHDRWLSVRAKQMYYQGDFDQQQRLYDRLNNKAAADFSMGTALYKQDRLQEAYAMRTGALQTCVSDNDCADVAFNAGNASFFLGSGAATREETKTLRQQAVDHYEQSLRLRDDPKTRHNKEIVESLLQELERQQQEQELNNQNGQQQQQWWHNSQQEPQNSQQSQGASSQDDWQDQQWQEEENTEGEERAHDTQGWQQRSGLSESDRQQLEQYQEQLEQQQRMAQEYFNKAPQQGQSWAPQDIFDMFFGAPQQREDMNSNTEEKDR